MKKKRDNMFFYVKSRFERMRGAEISEKQKDAFILCVLAMSGIMVPIGISTSARVRAVYCDYQKRPLSLKKAFAKCLDPNGPVFGPVTDLIYFLWKRYQTDEMEDEQDLAKIKAHSITPQQILELRNRFEMLQF